MCIVQEKFKEPTSTKSTAGKGPFQHFSEYSDYIYKRRENMVCIAYDEMMKQSWNIMWNDVCVCFLGVEHGQHDLYPDSAQTPGQCDGSGCVQRSPLLRSCGQHRQGTTTPSCSTYTYTCPPLCFVSCLFSFRIKALWVTSHKSIIIIFSYTLMLLFGLFIVTLLDL